MALFERGLKAKSIRVSKVRRIAKDLTSVDYILFDPAILEIFYFKHNVGDSNVINFFIGNSVVDNH